MRFVDTNILLYAISTDPREATKAAVARQLLDADDLGLSVQVLQEFYYQATRPKKENPLAHDQAVAFVESWLRFPVQEMTVEILRATLAGSRQFQLSYWDAAIIEAARILECDEVLSEDMNHGQSYGGIEVVNPFRTRRAKTNGNL